MDSHILQLLQEGATSVSNLLLKMYKRMSLTDDEMMLLIHLLSFQQEGNRFPTLTELEERMSMTSRRLIQSLQKLLKEDWITIDEFIDPQTGMRHEQYNLTPLYKKLYQTWREQQADPRSMDPYMEVAVSLDAEPVAIYARFEQAFGRPLAPFELENIHMWTEQDGYQEELILTALREAATVGKLHIRYIDRILLEWQKQQITTVEQARLYSLNFRRQANMRDHGQPL
ncbi:MULTISPECIES: DnaD domain-containing protein [Brevibacillus]|uniref:DnaD domain-containing protein n=1 Tax=Brevibacillus TaxID=55080 RepID=UPI000D10464D|nr:MULTISPECIES: DnaD domain protein [Brevibacillus]PSJ70802.1 DNA replication protein DnaD [Brevibacillus brevis]RED31152.1 DNA replication protein DnaD [Brevibacillus brevis]TQK63578.1 DNA replication protein DnaD [Brevibacillus sp. AG162]VEF89634.1 DNA replication protein dnaD [Brevibacillus brevis]GEC89927.1 DNA replication protein [Brevibacillus brevis]